MAYPARLVTADEFERMPKGEFRWELVRGRLIRMSPVAPPHGRITMALGARLWNHVVPSGLGEVWTEVGFVLASQPDTVRAPDVCFVSTGRLPAPDARGYYRGAPELAIEVLSPDDARAEVDEKVDDYLTAGARLVVVLDPQRRRATVYRPHGDPLTLTPSDTLDLDPVVPGFRVDLSEIFGESRNA